MAIKVGGTTVINDSRQLSNIASVDAATVSALGAAGVGGGGGGIELTTSEAVVEGDRLSFNFDTGKVEKAGRIGGTTQINNFGFNFVPVDIIYIPEIDKTAIQLYDQTNNQMKVVLGTQSATTGAYTWGTPQFLVSGNRDGTTLVYDSNVNRLVVFYRNTSTTLYCRLFSISGNNLTLTSTELVSNDVTIEANYTLAAHYNSSDNRTYIMYCKNNGNAVARVGTIGASSQTWSNEDGPNSGNIFDDNYPMALAITSVGSTTTFHWKDTPFNDRMVVAATSNGSSFTWGSEYVLYQHGSNSSGRNMAFRLSGSTVPNLCAWLFKVNSDVYVSMYTVSGTTISNYTTSTAAYNSERGAVGGYDAANDLYYGFGISSNTGTLYYNTQAGNTWYNNATSTVFNNQGLSVNCGTLNPQAGYFTVGLEGSNQLYAHKPIEDNYETFIGVAAEAASANTTVKINNAGTVATGLSGLTPTRAYRIKFDGTFVNDNSFASGLLNGTNRAKITGIALTSTTMLMLNDFLTAP